MSVCQLTLVDKEGRLGDFNDMVVRMNPVPIPGALLLLGAGLCRLAVRKRQQ